LFVKTDNEKNIKTESRLVISEYKKINYIEVIKDTGSAYLFMTDKGKVWIPRSQVAIHKISKEIIIPRWLFDKLKFIQ